MLLSPRAKFLLLIGVFLVPMVAAWIAYFGWRPDGHGNYGVLLPVAPLQHTSGTAVDGTPFDLTGLRGKWVMVHMGDAECDEDCRRQLYLMRQIRTAQGKEQARIERLWILEGQGRPAAALLEEHPGLQVWRPLSPGFSTQFSAERTAAAHIYLIDPLGNLMLRFPENPDAKRMMKDLKLLLKASQVG